MRFAAVWHVQNMHNMPNVVQLQLPAMTDISGKYWEKQTENKRGRLQKVLEIQVNFEIDSTAGCNVLLLLSGKFLLWQSRQPDKYAQYTHRTHTHIHRREGKSKGPDGGWLFIQTAGKGLVDGKAAFMSSQPSQQWQESPCWHPVSKSHAHVDATLKFSYMVFLNETEWTFQGETVAAIPLEQEIRTPYLV